MPDFNGLPRAKGLETDRRFIEALARGLDVLRAFQPGDGFLGNQEIARRTGLPKSSVSRFTFTLTQLGYLNYSERLEKYQLGSGVLALGYVFVSNLAIRQLARPLMQQLAASTGVSVGLAVRDRLEMIYIEYAAPERVKTFRHEVGDRIDIRTSALGRAYLAALPEDEREYLLDYIRQGAGSNWKKVKKGIDDALKSWRQNGFCSSFGEWNKDVNAIAVPLVIDQGHVYSFNCGGPKFRIEPRFLTDEVAPQLKNMARTIEAMLIRY